MTNPKLIWFALKNLSAMGYYHAGAEMYGGTERRARADVYRNLSNMTGAAIQTELKDRLKSKGVSGPVQDQL